MKKFILITMTIFLALEFSFLVSKFPTPKQIKTTDSHGITVSIPDPVRVKSNRDMKIFFAVGMVMTLVTGILYSRVNFTHNDDSPIENKEL